MTTIINHHQRQQTSGVEASPGFYRKPERAKIPVGANLTSLVGWGPIPFGQIIHTNAMVGKCNRGLRADGGSLTQMETVTRNRAVRRAQRRLDQAVRTRIEALIRTIKAEHAEINLIDQALANLTTASMMGPTGEQLSPAEATHTHNMLREQIAAELREGSRKHLTSARRAFRDLVLLLLDYPVLLFAMLGLLNVKLRLIGYDFATTLMTGVAALFALLGTALLAVVMRLMGRRHRAYKGDTGGLDPNRKTKTITIEFVAVITVITIAATVMASRVVVEGLAAAANPVLIAALAALFAFLIGFSAYLNYRAEFDNGSTETDQVQHLSLQLRGREHHHNSLLNARQLKVEQAGVNTAKLNRAIATARKTAITAVTNARCDKAIRLARSYTANPHTQLPEPDLDFTRLNLAAEQATQLTDHQKHLQTPPVQDGDLFTYLRKEI